MGPAYRIFISQSPRNGLVLEHFWEAEDLFKANKTPVLNRTFLLKVLHTEPKATFWKLVIYGCVRKMTLQK